MTKLAGFWHIGQNQSAIFVIFFWTNPLIATTFDKIPEAEKFRYNYSIGKI